LEIRSDIELKGEEWFTINDKMVKVVFDTIYDAFKLAVSIGIMYDEQLDFTGDTTASITRNLLHRKSEELSYFFKTAVLTSNQIDLSEKDRLYLAFMDEMSDEEIDEDEMKIIKKEVSKDAFDFNEVSFLIGFANYGAKRIVECYSSHDGEMMENLKNFLSSSFNEETEELKEKKKIKELTEE